MLGCCALAFGYYSFDVYIQGPISKFIHPVGRGADEPQLNPALSGSSITGQAWNILLLGSDNDGKYTFPAVLTQVMMVVHIDTGNNSVSLV